MNISLKSLINKLYYLLIFLAVFDGIRSFMVIIGKNISFLKELDVIFILILACIKFKSNLVVRFKLLMLINFLIIIYLLFFSTVIIFFNNYIGQIPNSIAREGVSETWALHLKTIESFIIIAVFLLYENLTGEKLQKLIIFFVKCCIAYVILTLSAYFIIDMSSIFDKPWFDRISIGYSTMDTQILCMGLACLFFGKLNIKRIAKIVFSLILIIGILMNSTSTGFYTFILLTFALIVNLLYDKSVKGIFTLKSFFVLFLSIICCVHVYQTYLESSDNIQLFLKLFERKTESIQNSFEQIFTGKIKQDNEDPSVYIRKQEIEAAFSEKDDIFSLVFGGPIRLAGYIENQNYFLIRAYGYVGIIIYYLWIVYLIFKSVINLKNPFSRMLLMTVFILVFSNFSLITSYLFGINACFALLLSYSFLEMDKKLSNKEVNVKANSF